MQRHVGKIVFFLTRPIGAKVEQGKPIGTIETAKWVGPIKSPVTGTISAVNEEARKNPVIIHEDPYGKGWLVTIKPEKFEEEAKLLLYGNKAIDWYRGDIERYKKTGELPKV
jgi:glycine cleavage system H protein